MTAATANTAHDALVRHLLSASERTIRQPVGLFGHPWLAPMVGGGADPRVGEYGGALYHHDASEASIELLRHPGLRDAAAGSLLCLLDQQLPNGLLARTVTPTRVRDPEPCRPVIAQWALRTCLALGLEWGARHRVLERVVRWVGFLEREAVGPHGLFLTWSSLASGFDNDPITAAMPPRSVAGPDTNAFMVREYSALAELFRRYGADAAPWEEKAARLTDRIEQIAWREDERGGFYAGIRWSNTAGSEEYDAIALPVPGGSAPIESWIGLVPLYAGVPTPERAEQMRQRAVDSAGYLGPAGLRTVPRWSPLFHQAPRDVLFDGRGAEPVSNWRGPVWMLSTYYVVNGLLLYGFRDAARAIAARAVDAMSADLAATGTLHECWNDAGLGLWPPNGGFVSWNVLAVALVRDLLAE